MPLVSVVIPTLNRCEKLRRCLISLMAQSLPDFEIIIVDGGSKDGTFDMLKEFEVRIVRQKYGGIVNAENLGIRNSKGEIIAFLDDDCFADPFWLGALIEPYTVYSGIGGTGGQVKIKYTPASDPERLALFKHLHSIYSNIVLEGVPSKIGLVSQSGALTQNFGLGQQIMEVDHVQGCNMSFLSEVLKDLGGLDENYSGTGFRWETDLCIRAKNAGHRIMFNPQAQVFHDTYFKKFMAPEYKYYSGRNDIYFFMKNLKPSNLEGWFRFAVWQSLHTAYTLYWYSKSHDYAYLLELLGKIHGFQLAARNRKYL